MTRKNAIDGKETSDTVSLRQLAVACRTTAQTLYAWMDKWPDFPVIKHGSRGVAALYSVSAVTDFLTAKRADLERTQTGNPEQLIQFSRKPRDEEAAAGPLKEQIDAVKLARLKREEAERTGVLVEAAAVMDALTGAYVGLQRTLRAAVRQACVDLNLPAEAVKVLMDKIEAAQRAFVREAEAGLERPEAVEPG